MAGVGQRLGLSGRKTAPSMGWIGVPGGRNFSSRTARSTPESMTATATPSPVARGSLRMRSGRQPGENLVEHRRLGS